jgi:hypothetical protein
MYNAPWFLEKAVGMKKDIAKLLHPAATWHFLGWCLSF